MDCGHRSGVELCVKSMSEFKFACPVCGQHITADSSASGGQLECPTCFRKIVIPQAPSSAQSKFIVSASQVSEPRPLPSGIDGGEAPQRASMGRTSMLAGAALLVVICAAGGAVWAFRERIFKPSGQQAALGNNAGANNKTPAAPRKIYPIPTNVSWTLDLTNAVIPDQAAVGSIHGSGFFCERATLQGGNLSLRQGGKGGSPDLGLTINFFAHEGEELSGKTIEIPPDRAPPLPPIEVRWKEGDQKSIRRKINEGYALRIVFGEAAFKRIPGKIYVGLPDGEKSFVAGTFEAEIHKPPAPKPRQPKQPKPPG